MCYVCDICISVCGCVLCLYLGCVRCSQAQEEELKKAQTELITLRKEEQQLEQQVETGKSQLTTVEESLNQTNQQITEVKTYKEETMGPLL